MTLGSLCRCRSYSIGPVRFFRGGMHGSAPADRIAARLESESYPWSASTASTSAPAIRPGSRRQSDACEPVSPGADDAQTFLQDTFAGVVAAATRARGEPTQRRPGNNPEVRWRGEEATVGVKRVSVQVDIFLATNEFIDDYDWAESRGL